MRANKIEKLPDNSIGVEGVRFTKGLRAPIARGSGWAEEWCGCYGARQAVCITRRTMYLLRLLKVSW